MTYDLSIIIAAHREGLIAHKTLLSVERAVQPLISSGIKFEVIVTIDNGNDETKDYFNKYDKLSLSVHEISHGDLAASRNYGIAHSSGTYIAILDADDLISVNWLIDGYRRATETNQETVFHTSHSVNFGTQNILWEKFDSRSKAEDAIIMTWANRWDSAIIAPRSIFERFPYQPNTNGYGSEDWHFNSETLAADIPHKVIKNTILFVRRKDVSEMTIQAADKRTVHYTNLLSIDHLKSLDTSPYRTAKHTSSSPLLAPHAKQILTKAVRFAHRKAKHLPLYTKATQSVLRNYHHATIRDSEARFPAWLINEWRAIHHIDKAIFPSQELLATIPVYHSEMYELGVAFKDIMTSFTKEADYIIFVPALWQGGAETVALNFVRALKNARPDWHIAVATTEADENVWKDRLPEGVDFIDFGNMTHGLSEPLRHQLLARMIVQSKATHLHIAQSSLLFRFAALHQSLLRNYSVNAFAFCEDTDNEGRISGHIHSGLSGAYPVLGKIFTDNQKVIDQLVAEYAFDPAKFSTQYQPVDVTLLSPRPQLRQPIRILWASRISKQKRPDILRSIAERLDPAKFHIDVYGLLEDGYDANFFTDIPALTYKGPFNGIGSLDTARYDIFLYTSENDGLPNILLEITACGLPIVAPNIGGISEFINEQTGTLINDPVSIDEYVTSIKQFSTQEVLKDKLEKVQRAQQLIAERHSFNHYESQIKTDLRV